MVNCILGYNKTMKNYLADKQYLLVQNTNQLLAQNKIDQQFASGITAVAAKFVDAYDFLKEKPRDAYDLLVFLEAKSGVNIDTHSFFRYILVPAVALGLIKLQKLSSSQYAQKTAYINYFDSLAFMSKHKKDLDGMFVSLADA